MNLYHVQDSDRPMYVVADSWMSALDMWQVTIAGDDPGADIVEPQGIALVGERIQLIVQHERIAT